MQAEVKRKTYVRFYRSGPNPEHGTIGKVDKGGCGFGAPIIGDDPRDIGAFNNKYVDAQVAHRDLRQLEVPEDVFGLRFFDRYEAVIEEGGHGVPLVSKDLNWSKLHFWGGTVLNRDAVEALKAEMSILAFNLLDNMEYFGWTHVVHTPQGHYKPFDAKDILVNPENLPPTADAVAA